MPHPPRIPLSPLALLMLCSLIAGTLDAHAQRKERRPKATATPCYLGIHTMPWENDGSLCAYVNTKMRTTAPPGLLARVERTSRNASLRFSFDDPYHIFYGHLTGEDSTQTTKSSERRQWMGMDLFAESIARDLILDVTTFDEEEFANVSQVSCLSGPLNIRLSIILQDTMPLNVTVPGEPVYTDDFKFLHPRSDTLQIPVEVDGEDTLITVVSGQVLNVCQLAALKGIGLQLILRQQLDKYCGPPLPNLERIDREKRGIFPIGWHRIGIFTNDPALKAPYAIELSLHFHSIIELSEVMAKD